MLTIFTTAKPFEGHNGMIQRNALKSWTLLDPEVEVIVFGDDAGAAEVCREFGLRHEPHVERSALGSKRLDYIFMAAQRLARHDLICYVNCDILLTADFAAALRRTAQWNTRFLMVGRRWDTDITEPLDFSSARWQEDIIARARTTGYQRFYHNIDYFAFPRGLYAQIPPLVVGRVWWDHWLVGKAQGMGAAVVDVSEVVCAVHENHDYGYHPNGLAGVFQDEDACRNRDLARSDLARCNSRMATIEDAPYRLTTAGMRRNFFYWLAPTKRRWRDAARGPRAALRRHFWHPLLDATRGVRHAIGLKASGSPDGRLKRHPMDQ